MTPEQKERYDKRCRELWAELNQIITKYVEADKDIDVILAMGALSAEMVHILHHAFDGDDRRKFLDEYCAKMRMGLKQMETVEKLKALAK